MCECENLLTRATRSLPVSPANQVKGHNCVRINRSGRVTHTERLSIFRKVSAALRALRRPDAALPVSSELVFNNPPRPAPARMKQSIRSPDSASNPELRVHTAEWSRPVAEYVRRALHINTQTKGNAPSRTFKWTQCISAVLKSLFY